MDLPKEFHMHHTFNVADLSSFMGTHAPPIPLPPVTTHPVRSHVYRVVEIHDSAPFSSSSGDYTRYLVHWVGIPEAEDS